MTDEQALEDRVAALESKLDAFEFQNDGPPTEAALKDIWIAGQPVGKLLDELRNRSKDLEDRVTDLELGEIDPADIMSGIENGDLPIQVKTAARKAGRLTERNCESKNQFRATYVWEDFIEHAIADHGKYRLSSSQVTNICKKYDLPTDRQTVGRIMAFTARLSCPQGKTDDPTDERNLLTLENGEGKSTLVASQDDLHSFLEDQEQQIAEQAREEMHQLTQAGAMTSD